MSNSLLAEVISHQDQLEQDLLLFGKATSDQLRLNVLRLLKNQSYGVMELCEMLDVRQSNMSHHLKLLTQAGLVNTRKEGNSIFYYRAFTAKSESLKVLQEHFLNTLDQTAPNATVQINQQQIHQQRLEKSKQFFQQHAERFQQQQDLISPYNNYGCHVAKLLNAHLPESAEKALEVGPGQGEFLQQLAPLFKQVYALDNSQSMLQIAQSRCQKHKLDNIDFFHGDTRHPWLSQLSVDYIVVNMVLHHHPDPAEMFQDLAGCCRSKGHLLITDLAQHQQSWAADSCGDLWLGFTHEQLDLWARQAGFKLITNANIAQRNGFSVMIKLFRKL